jgi:hypothetical protein
MIIEPFKMKVNPEQSKIVQEVLFANGYKWKNGARRVLNTNYSFLYFNDGRELAHQINDAAYFVDNHLKEISFEQFLSKYTGNDIAGYDSTLREILIKSDMKKESIGYKLKNVYNDYKYRKACEAFIPAGKFDWDFPIRNQCFISLFKQAGVLDLWFEPVYKEPEPDISVSGYKAQFDLQNKTVKFGCKTISLEQLKAVLTVMYLNEKFDYGFCIASDFIESYHLHDFAPVTKQTIEQLIQTLEK